jgi:O-acetylhomoserine/O-acetylserine sulfhydrylase-like pyridoxal-dependent enzyme
MSCRDIPPAEGTTLGTGDDLIRLSVGVEEGRDSVGDIE